MPGNLDENTMNILRGAMSSQAALNSMGYANDPEFNRQMEEKDAKLAAARARAVTGGVDTAAAPQAARQQPVVSSRRKRGGMARQRGLEASMPLQPADGAMPTVPDDGDHASLPPELVANMNKINGLVSVAENDFKERAIAEVRAEDDAAKAISGGWTARDGFELDGDGASVMANTAAPEVPTVQEHEDSAVRVSSVREQTASRAPFDRKADDGNFNAYVQITNWISEGLAYPDPIYGQSLKLGDMFMLKWMDSSSTTYQAPEILDTIIGRHVRGIDPGDILSCDEIYLLHWLRASSYPLSGLPGPRHVCDKCHFDISKSEFANYTIGFQDLVFIPSSSPAEVIGKHRELGYVKFNAYDGRECHVYLRRRRHANEIAAAKAAWEAENKAKYPKYYDTAITMAAVIEIEDCEGIENKFNYIWNYPTSKRNEFLNAIADASLSTTVKARVKCPECGGVAEVPYPFRIHSYISGL